VEKLNQVYGAVDVGVNTCIGEGWGLVNFEHAAAGVAQVVPDHTSLKEIFNDIPRIECIGSETDRNYGLERPLPDPQSMADLLTMYYEDRNKLQATADWCYERVTSPEFSWDVIGKQMLGIVNRLLSTPKTKASGQGFGTPAKIV
jgi:glycosyltransferase involved in cell wall biosynthesis